QAAAQNAPSTIEEAVHAILDAPTPIAAPPALFGINGFGLRVYGSRNERPDGSSVTTRFITALFVPLLPRTRGLTRRLRRRAAPARRPARGSSARARPPRAPPGRPSSAPAGAPLRSRCRSGASGPWDRRGARDGPRPRSG